MDVLGNIMDLPIPTLMPPLAAKSITETTGTGPATENGYRNQLCIRPEVVKDRPDRNKHAKIYMFRYNQLSPEAIRVIVDGTVKPNSLQWEKEVQELKHFAIEIQGKAVGTGLSGNRKWWVEFVGATVSEMNFYAYLHNLVREVQKARFTPVHETARSKANREAKRLRVHTMLGLKCSAYKALLEKEIEGHEAYLKTSKNLPVSQRDCSEEGNCKDMIVSHQDHLKQLQAILEKAVEVPESDFELAPKTPYYAEMTVEAIRDFWQDIWSIDVAASFYKWAAGVVDVADNAYAPDIGDIMATTFINSAHATWRYVLAPRYENEVLRTKSTKPFPSHLFRFSESPDIVKQEYRNAANEFGDRGGIELQSKSVGGGFAFEYHNTWYPDVDDTAAVVLAFTSQDPQSISTPAVERATEWILNMQNSDGGWAAFDLNNDKLFLNKIPFCDMNNLCDPSSADVTGRVLEAFGLMKQASASEYMDPGLLQRIEKASDRALLYLARTQEPSGAWYGRWGVNYIYGTSNVLCGLEYFSEDRPFVRDMMECAATWLKWRQNPEGGWGEGLESYPDPSKAGRGNSTPSQTAWALMGLLTVLDPGDEAVEKGVTRLLQSQTDVQIEGASWPETLYTATGFPEHFYLGYSFYRHYFPMMALGRYLRANEKPDGTRCILNAYKSKQ